MHLSLPPKKTNQTKKSQQQQQQKNTNPSALIEMSKSMGMRCLYSGATCPVENNMQTIVDKACSKKKINVE